MKWKDTFVKAVIYYLLSGDANKLYCVIGIALLAIVQYLFPYTRKSIIQLFLNLYVKLKSLADSLLALKPVTSIVIIFKKFTTMKYLINIAKWFLPGKNTDGDLQDDLADRMCAYSENVYTGA